MGFGISASACGRCHACACVYVCICMRMRMWVSINIYVHFFAVSNVCTLEQVFWALVHGLVCMLHRCVFYTNAHICDTLAAGCAHMCICSICVYIHAYVYACVCASMILLDTLRRCY